MILRFVFCCLFLQSISQLAGQAYFQQQVDYDIKAELDTVQQQLRVQGTMTYKNNSDDMLDHLVMHLWWNAFSDKQSAFARQQFDLRQLEFHFAPVSDMGGYENVEFSDKSGPLLITVDAEYPDDKDIAKVILNEPLEPGQRTRLRFDCTLKIPKVFSRPGYDDDLYRMTQWYPKPAVYDTEGWHPMPYLSIGEYYSEYGNYQVELTVPASHKLSSTGVESTNIKNGDKITYRFSAENVLDFAWFSSENFELYSKSISIQGKEIELHILSNTAEDTDIFFEYMEAALDFYSEKVGLYPYPQYSLVYDAGRDRGGMEYPMISMVDMGGSGQNLDNLIAHEIGHNWFQSALGSNERDFPWLDEGLNSYYERAYNDSRYPQANYETLSSLLKSKDSEFTNLQSGICHLHCCGLLGPIDQKSQDVDLITYGSNSYERMAWTMAYLEGYLGENIFDEAMHEFYATWLHRHPSPAALQATFENKSKENLDWFFTDILKKNRRFDYSFDKVEKVGNAYEITLKNSTAYNLPIQLSCYDEQEKPVYNKWVTAAEQENKISLPEGNFSRISINGEIPFLDNNRTNNHYRPNSLFKKSNPIKIGLLGNSGDSRYNSFSLLPVVSYSAYDGVMAGINIYSDFYPYRKTRVYLQPQYGLGSNELVGKFAVQRDMILNEKSQIRKITFGLKGKRYNYFQSIVTNEISSYFKLVPSLTLHFKSDMLVTKKLRYNFHYIKPEERATEVNLNSRIHQLQYTVDRPTRLGALATLIQAEYERYQPFGDLRESYLKLTLEHKRSMRYQLDSRIHFRFFAGYFPHNTNRESSSYASVFNRGAIALTQQGYTDHTYEGSYFGRTEIMGWETQQFSEEEGGFKVPLGAAFGNIANSNSLGLALNLKADLPLKPLRAIGLRPWADLGMLRTKKVNNDPLESQWYYAAGLSLELGDFLGLYYPLVYSEEYDIPLANKSFFEKLSFKIDLLKFSFWDLSERPAFLF